MWAYTSKMKQPSTCNFGKRLFPLLKLLNYKSSKEKICIKSKLLWICFFLQTCELESAVDDVRDGCLVVTSVSHMHNLLNAGFE